VDRKENGAMSVEKVQAFFEKAAEDTDLQKKLKALGEREEALYADLVAIATKAGFQFTTADARKARVAMVRKLSKEELEAVAGGMWRVYCPADLPQRAPVKDPRPFCSILGL
jgi:predicted ribosomally synthesized peptide with nif11-like leader